MDEPRLYRIDAFTTEPGRGNPAGVVTHADALDEARMQAIAREMGFSETAFVLRASGDDHDVRLRFFTPTTEVPVCGHATVGQGTLVLRAAGGLVVLAGFGLAVA